MALARLIVTADDAGALLSIDDAIVSLLDRGVLTRAAAFPNGATFGDFIARAVPRHEIVPHIALTFGCPLGDTAGLGSLLNERGQFRQPLDYYDDDVGAAIRAWVEQSYLNGSDVAGAEIRRQCAHFASVVGLPTGDLTFHHDIDQLVLDGWESAAIREFSGGRTAAVRSGKSSGYIYRFLPSGLTDGEAEAHVAGTLQEAIELSATSGGLPAEAIFHPAAETSTLEHFTVYIEGRLQEFRALQSEHVSAIFAGARRNGSTYEFG